MAKTKTSSFTQAQLHHPQKQVTGVSQEVEIAYSGPLPDPATFAFYERTTQGAGERILAMAENEQRHRHEMERLMTEAYSTDTLQERREVRRAQWMAWTLAFGVTCIGGFLVYAEHPVAGTLLTGGTLIGIISTFLSKNRTEKREGKDQPHQTTARK